MFFMKLFQRVEALESKVEINIKADISTLMARIRRLEIDLANQIAKTPSPTVAPEAPKV